MKLLIAGGNGYIGSYLRFHLKSNITTTIIDSKPNATIKNSYSLDLTIAEHVNSFVNHHERFDVLIFLVGLAHEKGKGKDLPIFTKVNYQTLVNLMSSMKSAGKVPEKIILSSTISVYGERRSQNVYLEESRTIPISPYAVTKLMAEKYLLSNFKDRTWIMRLAPVYSTSFMLNINRRTRRKKWFFKVGKGNAKLSLCNIDNIVSSIDGIIYGTVPTGVYNISDPIDYCYADLIRIMGGGDPIMIPRILVNLSYLIGMLSGNLFLKENSIKLLCDNKFVSEKIRTFIDLSATFEDIPFKNDI